MIKSNYRVIQNVTNWILLHKRKAFIFVSLISIGIGIISLGNKKVIEDEEFLMADIIIPTVHSIYFHETSNKGELTIRQACSVESSVRMNSQSKVNVIFSSAINKKSETLKVLNKFENFSAFLLDFETYVRATPLEKFDVSVLKKSTWPMHIMSDALRYLTLYKFGGVYLDLDVVVIRPLKFLGNNWAYREKWHVGSAAMAFDNDKLGRYVAAKAVLDFRHHFNEKSYDNNGPWVITRVLTELCYRKFVEIQQSRTGMNCEGFSIFNNKTFSPLSYTTAHLYFASHVYQLMDFNQTDVYGHHMYNYVTKDIKIEKNSYYAKLAKEFCPTIYRKFIQEFSN